MTLPNLSPEFRQVWHLELEIFAQNRFVFLKAADCLLEFSSGSNLDQDRAAQGVDAFRRKTLTDGDANKS